MGRIYRLFFTAFNVNGVGAVDVEDIVGMDISRLTRATPSSGARRPSASTAASGFSVTRSADAAPGEADAAAPVASAGSVASVDAVLALQGGGDEATREHAARHALTVLDQLDSLRLAVLGGQDSVDAVARLRDVVSSAPGETGDAVLDGLTNQVSVRAAVELAKRDMGEQRGGRPARDEGLIAVKASASIYPPTSGAVGQGERS